MAQDKFDILGLLMNEIGQRLSDIADGDPEGVFLYVEIAEGWVSPSVFKEDGKTVRYLDSEQTGLDGLLFEAWHAEPEGKRWSVMEYGIKDGRFSVEFKFPEEVDVETVQDDERRDEALRRRYGDKPIIYPPPPQGAFELKP